MAEQAPFKMSFKSPLATKLKASISRKLLDFIPDYIENDDLAGLAYVDFSDEEHLASAVAKNRQVLHGKKLNIAKSDPKQKRNTGQSLPPRHAPPNLDDYSPSSTVIYFDNPIPLLRHPIPTNTPESPYTLAFKTPESFHEAHKSTISKITTQCESGARIGCAIAASNACKPPWWRQLFGRSSINYAEKAECEEREMAGCVALAKERCGEFAKEKCLAPFRDARVVVKEEVNWKAVSRVIGWASASPAVAAVGLVGVEDMNAKCLLKCVTEVSTCRGSELIIEC